jgi:hypothetical protein
VIPGDEQDGEQPAVMPISDVRLGEAKRYRSAVGDTWDPTWAEDDALYFAGNDGSGWDKACSSNVFFNRATGHDLLDLQGETLNGMAEYGGWAQKGPDGCTWKSTGCISIDGVLYLAVARHKYGTQSGDPFRRQTADRASIIKSADSGLTWVRSAVENYAGAMFAGARFATPYFIHYGRDGKAPPVDHAQRYVYAIANNGFWCNGDDYILGRVPRSRIGRLDAADWTFYTGGEGLQDRAWSGDPSTALPIIEAPRTCGETGATYLPSAGRYILVAWSYPGDPNVETDETRLVFYEAPHPWGPWQRTGETISRPEGWYCPRVVSKGQRRVGDEINAFLATGGDYYEMDSHYRLTIVPLKLKIGGRFPPLPEPPTPLPVAHDAIGDGLHRFRYQGTWEGSDTGHTSVEADASCSLDFTGSRLRWCATKQSDCGLAAVSVDGGEETLVDLYTYCEVPQHGRLLYDTGPLEGADHTLTIRATGQRNAKSAGNRIFNGWVEITR